MSITEIFAEKYENMTNKKEKINNINIKRKKMLSYFDINHLKGKSNKVAQNTTIVPIDI